MSNEFASGKYLLALLAPPLMLTIRRMLEMPIFSNSQLVAGAGGLENQIRWVHIIDIPDAHYEWERSGVLLLTSGMGIHDSAARQAALIPKLVAEGFSGLLLAKGYYFDAIPDVMRQQANVLNFPLMESPNDILFIEVTEAIHSYIVNHQYQLLQQSNRIYDQLTDLVLQGATLDDLAATLAQLLQRSITIESPSFHILAAAQVGKVDEARERSLRNGRSTPEVAHRLLGEGVYKALLSQMAPLRVAPIPELQMTMERFVAPIIVDREIQGYIWIIAGNRPLTDLDEQAITHAATVAALILFKETAVREAEEKLKGDFFDRILRGEISLVEVEEIARQIKISLDSPYQLLLIQSALPSGNSRLTMMRDVEKWLKIKKINALFNWQDGFLLLLLESNDGTFGKQVAQSMLRELNHPAQKLLIGISNNCTPLRINLDSIRLGYEQARETININMIMGNSEGVVLFADLGLLHWLYHLSPEQRIGNIYLQYIEQLTTYDSQRGANLLQTLEQYLDEGCTLVDAANALHIHRNTLLNRLERIEKICGLDLRMPIHQLNLHVALRSYRLHKGR